jgi:tRNA-2-methylthio-N6-dimethylallyladenosine synthase
MPETEQQRTYHIITYGCQMNDSDSERMGALLEGSGYRSVSTPDAADVVLINTCSVRAKPENKTLTALGELRLLREQKPNLLVGVCGCMAQREGEALRSKAQGVDLLVGTANVDRIAELVEAAWQSRRSVSALDMPITRQQALSWRPSTAPVPATGKLRAFVPIIEGCNNFCTFCVVPSTRGRERSRPITAVVEEVRRLVASGTREVTLLGQNVNSYLMVEDGGRRKAGHHFADLLSALNDVEGLLRIRFTTSYPVDFREEMIQAVARLPKVCEWIHLPVQAGDNTVLGRMKRGYTREEYLALVARIRDQVPDVVLSTDLMVGFPGETVEQFENTLSLVGEARFDSAYTFAYSPRPNTPATAYSDQVTHMEKQRRLGLLIEEVNRVAGETNRQRLGTELEVLVEGPAAKNPAQLCGHSRGNHTVNFEGPPELVGGLARVRATDAFVWGFLGQSVQENARSAGKH